MAQHFGATQRRPRPRALAVALLAVVLTGCGTREEVEVQTMPAPGPGPATAASSTFQGRVAAVDPAAGEFLLAVQLVWTPVMSAEPHERRVVVDPATRWEPAPGAIALLHAGDDVQVEGEELGDGRWRASSVLLLDID